MRISDWSSDVCSSDLALYDSVVERINLFAGECHSELSHGNCTISISSIRSSGSRNRLATIARSEEHTSELQSLMRISYAVFCLKKQKTKTYNKRNNINTQQLQKLSRHTNKNSKHNTKEKNN